MIELTRQEALDTLQSARQNVYLAGQSRLAARVSSVSQMLQDAWAAADKLDAPRAEPERREGRCFCGDDSADLCVWQRYSVADDGGFWCSADYPDGFEWKHCPWDCGAALRDGYAERGGDPADTRRIDAMTWWFLTYVNEEAARYMMADEGEWIIDLIKADEHFGRVKIAMLPKSDEPFTPDIRAALDDAASPAAPGGDETGDDPNG